MLLLCLDDEEVWMLGDGLESQSQTRRSSFECNLAMQGLVRMIC